MNYANFDSPLIFWSFFPTILLSDTSYSIHNSVVLRKKVYKNQLEHTTSMINSFLLIRSIFNQKNKYFMQRAEHRDTGITLKSIVWNKCSTQICDSLNLNSISFLLVIYFNLDFIFKKFNKLTLKGQDFEEGGKTRKEDEDRRGGRERERNKE